MSRVDEAELKILFETICDGVKQEVRHRQLLTLVEPNIEWSLSEEREAQHVASIAYHLQMVGFMVQIESYFFEQPPARRPDLSVYLPACRKIIFLEYKTFQPYTQYDKVIEDVEKLSNINDPKDKRNGIITLGFRYPTKTKENFEEKYRKMSEMITGKYPFREFEIRRIELEDMDEKSVYAMVGFWVRNLR